MSVRNVPTVASIRCDRERQPTWALCEQRGNRWHQRSVASAPTLGQRAVGAGYAPSVSRSRYDGLADEYENFLRTHGYEGARDVLRRLLGRGSGACLDIGCGGGYFLDVPTALGWRLVGIDASRDQLRVA